jgi:hypothetical protein
MADGLPEGLVTNTEAISGDIQSVDRIAAEDLAHLWRGNARFYDLSRCPKLIPLPQCTLPTRIF